VKPMIGGNVRPKRLPLLLKRPNPVPRRKNPKKNPDIAPNPRPVLQTKTREAPPRSSNINIVKRSVGLSDELHLLLLNRQDLGIAATAKRPRNLVQVTMSPLLTSRGREAETKNVPSRRSRRRKMLRGAAMTKNLARTARPNVNAGKRRKRKRPKRPRNPRNQKNQNHDVMRYVIFLSLLSFVVSKN
jgi:hypothetical protein